MKRKKALIIAGIILCSAAIICRIIAEYRYIDSYEECIARINASELLTEGQIDSYQYLSSGKKEAGDYIKFLARFADGTKRILKVDIRFHRHLRQTGPDYRVLSAQVEKVPKLAMRYLCENNRFLSINLNTIDGKYFCSDQLKQRVHLEGELRCDEYEITFINEADRYVFLADEDFLIFLKDESDYFEFFALDEDTVFFNTGEHLYG